MTFRLNSHSPSIALVVMLGLFASAAYAEEPKDSKPPTFDPDPGENVEIEDSPFEDLELACIESGDGRSCHQAAVYWHEGRGISKPNPRQAYNLYIAGCSFGYAPSCLGAATMIVRAQAGFFILRPEGILSLDFGEAARLAGAACSLGYLAGCGLHGDLMMDPDGQLPNDATIHRNIKHDALAARQSYRDGCPEPRDDDDLAPTDRDARSCGRLAQMHEEGIAGLSKDWDRAVLYYQLACEASGGVEEFCDRADLMEAEGPEVTPERPRTSIQPRRPKPNVERFRTDPQTRIEKHETEHRQDSHARRFELELGIGARWTYGNTALAGMKLRFGANIWFNVLGFSIDGGFTTDKFAHVAGRTYLRFQQGFGPMVVIPIRHRLPYPIALRIVFGGGATVGALKRGPSASYILGYGARQRIQVEAGTNQKTGARQFGALRFEQQQTWYTDQGDAVEHSTQVVFLAGFTFGGRGGDWTPKKN